MINNKQTVTITKENIGKRIDKFLASYYLIPYSKVMKSFRKKDVTINGKKSRDHSYLLNEKDEITTFFKDVLIREKPAITTTKKQFLIIYQDKNIIIVNKKQGVVISGEKDSLLDQVRAYLYQDKNYIFDPAFLPTNVHQIDKQTEGIVVFACNYVSFVMLQKCWHNIHKEYRAWLEGEITTSQELKNYIVHDNQHQKMMIAKSGKLAISHLKPIRYLSNSDETLCSLVIKSGKKHQIRVQSSYIGHPVVGDWKYGRSSHSRLQLLSYKIIFNELSGNLSYLNGKTFLIENNNYR